MKQGQRGEAIERGSRGNEGRCNQWSRASGARRLGGYGVERNRQQQSPRWVARQGEQRSGLFPFASYFKNCQWIYRIRTNPGMSRGGVLPPTPVLAPGSALGSRPRVARSSAQVPRAYSEPRPPGNSQGDRPGTQWGDRMPRELRGPTTIGYADPHAEEDGRSSEAREDVFYRHTN